MYLETGHLWNTSILVPELPRSSRRVGERCRFSASACPGSNDTSARPRRRPPCVKRTTSCPKRTSRARSSKVVPTCWSFHACRASPGPTSAVRIASWMRSHGCEFARSGRGGYYQLPHRLVSPPISDRRPWDRRPWDRGPWDRGPMAPGRRNGNLFTRGAECAGESSR
jgi:hypothetical protein